MSKKNRKENNVATLERETVPPVTEETEGQTQTTTPEIAAQDAEGTKPEPKPAKPAKKTDGEILEETIAAFDLSGFCATYGIDENAFRALVMQEQGRTFQGRPLNPASLPVRVYDVLNAQDTIYTRHALVMMEGRKETETIKDFFLAVLHLAPSALGSHIKGTRHLTRESLYMYPIGK